MENKVNLPKYITIPMALFGTGLSMTALCIYGFLLSRHTLSCINGQKDGDGRVYVVYPIASLAADVGRTRFAVMDAMRELEEYELIVIRRRGVKSVSMIYVKVPECGENPTIPELSCGENTTSHVGKKQPVMLGKGNTNNIYNNRNNNNTSPDTGNRNSSYTSPNGWGRGQNQRRKDTGSSMFAPIPDYENCDYGYGY